MLLSAEAAGNGSGCPIRAEVGDKRSSSSEPTNGAGESSVEEEEMESGWSVFLLFDAPAVEDGMVGDDIGMRGAIELLWLWEAGYACLEDENEDIAEVLADDASVLLLACAGTGEREEGEEERGTATVGDEKASIEGDGGTNCSVAVEIVDTGVNSSGICAISIISCFSFSRVSSSSALNRSDSSS